MREADRAMVTGKELILELFAQTAIKNVRFRSSPAQAVRYIARNAFQNAKQATRLTQIEITGPLKKGKSPPKRRNHFFHVEKNALKYLDEIRRRKKIKAFLFFLRKAKSICQIKKEEKM